MLELEASRLPATLDGASLADRLMEPTRIYVKSLLKLLRALPVHGLAHITGGGLLDNIPRVVPEGLEVRLARGSWALPELFTWLQAATRLSDEDMHRTFNCGIGMTVHVAPSDAERALALLRESGETATVIGTIEAGTRGVVIA